MNYYIDFDSTLYNSSKLAGKMLEILTNSMIKQKDFNKESLLNECKSMFNREHIYNIYELIDYFADKYSLTSIPLVEDINKTILNRSDLVFDDVIPFLKELKSRNHKIYLLSNCDQSGLQFQTAKILGSQIIGFFDGITISLTPKYKLDLDYSNGIFIDDRPIDLLGLYSKNPIEVIRIRRKENKYSVEDIEKCGIKEYISLADVPIR